MMMAGKSAGEDVAVAGRMSLKSAGEDVAVAGRMSLEEQLDVMARQLNEITGELSRQREERLRWSELVADVVPLAKQSMTTVTSHLEEDACNFDDL
ncbi:MAG: hypothetical protein M1280_01500, partial [Actinobacteria bacterium]|nr:hypothetical protein [Actinomycetota bacterium]